MDKRKITIFHQLKDLYKAMLKMKEEEIKEVCETLRGMNVEGIVDYYIEISGETQFDDMDLVTCKKLVEIFQFIYNNTAVLSPITDDKYDQLYQVILDNGIGDIVGAVNSQGKPVRAHVYPDLRGSLSKVHYILNVDKYGDKRLSVEDWITSIQNILGYELSDDERFMIIIQPKWDGVSVVFECDEVGNIEHALLRGDTGKNLAVDIKELFVGWLNFKELARKNKKFGVKTEVLMSRMDYERMCAEQQRDFSSPRSATSSIVNPTELEPELGKYLSVQALRIQFEGEPAQLIHGPYDLEGHLYNLRDLEFKISEINKKIKEDGLVTDGAVLYLVNKDIQRRLGRNGAINRFEVAFKFPAEAQKTTLKEIDFSAGLGGNITPVAKIEPVIMKGNVIKSISLGSVERYLSLDLHQGDDVIIRYEIIPYLETDEHCVKNLNGHVFEVPTHCKYCDHQLVEDPLLKCVNDECPSRVIGNVVNYINKMRIENIGFETVAELFDRGMIKGIESLYELERYKEQIITLPGWGEKSYQNIIKGIEDKMEVFDYELMGSIGIPSIGERIFMKILDIIPLDRVLTLANERMLAVTLVGLPGFGVKRATMVERGVQSKIQVIEYLLKVLTLKSKEKNVGKKGKVCFTKVRDNDFKNTLLSKGYEVSDSMTNETTVLIVPTLDIQSNKVDRAKKNGIQIMTLDEAIRNL